MSYYTREAEYQELLSICRKNDIGSPRHLSAFITRKRLGRRFPSLAGDVDFSNGGTLHNGISPDYYGKLCRDLGFDGPRSKTYVTGFTPNGDLW